MIPAVVGFVEDGFGAFLAPDEVAGFFGVGEVAGVALGEVAVDGLGAGVGAIIVAVVDDGFGQAAEDRFDYI